MLSYAGLFVDDAMAEDIVQQVAALSINYGLFAKRFSLSAGLDLEYCDMDGTFFTTDNSKLDYSTLNLLPSASLNYRFKNGWRFNVMYNTRVRRPSVNNLNPYVNNSNPNHISVGNPHLDAEYGHMLNVILNSSGTKKFGYTLKASTMVVGNAIQLLTTVDADNISTTTYDNIGQRILSTAGLTLRYGTMSDRFRMSAYCSYTNDYIDSSSADVRSRSLNGYWLGADMNIPLWPHASLSARYSFRPLRSDVQSNREAKYRHLVDFVLGQRFAEGKYSFFITVRDPFRWSYNDEEYLSNSTYTMWRKSENMGCVITCSFSWTFGRLKDTVRKAEVSTIHDSERLGD